MEFWMSYKNRNHRVKYFRRLWHEIHTFHYSKTEGGETDLFCEFWRTPAVSAVASAACWRWRWPVWALPLGNREISGRRLGRRQSGRVLQDRRARMLATTFTFFSFIWSNLRSKMACPCSLTVPQGPPSGVEEGAVEVVMVTVVGVVVLGDDVLQVGVLPVQVAGLDRPREHGPVRSSQGICETHIDKYIKRS